MSETNIVKVAVCAAGGVDKVAARMGRTKSAIYGWIHRQVVPRQYIHALAKMTDGMVTVERLLMHMAKESEPAEPRGTRSAA